MVVSFDLATRWSKGGLDGLNIVLHSPREGSTALKQSRIFLGLPWAAPQECIPPGRNVVDYFERCLPTRTVQSPAEAGQVACTPVN